MSTLCCNLSLHLIIATAPPNTGVAPSSVLAGPCTVVTICGTSLLPQQGIYGRRLFFRHATMPASLPLHISLFCSSFCAINSFPAKLVLRMSSKKVKKAKRKHANSIKASLLQHISIPAGIKQATIHQS